MTSDATVLAKLDSAILALSEAKTLGEVKSILDVAEAAKVYARKAKLEIEAQNYAAEVALWSQRRAGEMLAQLERGHHADTGSNGQYRASNVGHSVSEYSAALREVDVSRQDAHRWQVVASVPEHELRTYIEDAKDNRRELTTTGALRLAKEIEHERKRVENSTRVASVSLDATPAHQFATIVIDPPWSWDDEGDVNQFGRAKPRYSTLTLQELHVLPVGNFAADNAHLYMWITNRSLPKGFGLIESWGFRYITCLTWVKPSFGMGNYFRGQTEHVLFAVRGSLPLLRHDAATVFYAQRGPNGHSSKPIEFYDLVESCSSGPYLEMFSRNERVGWSMWGENGS